MDSKLRNSFMNTSIRTIDESNYRITHTVNTKAVDRYNTIVLPRGAKVDNFLKNAVVLWAHNMDRSLPKIPIGRCVELNIEEDAVVVTTEFNSNDELAVRVFNAYKDGFLHAWSIGFIPTKYKKFDEENVEDLNKKYGLNVSTEQIKSASWGLYLIYQWELLEYSAVPVPGNPEALSADDAGTFKRELVTRGLLEEQVADEINFNKVLERVCPEDSEEKKDGEDVKEDVKEEPKVEDENKPEAEAEEKKDEVKEPEAEAEEKVEDKEEKEDVEDEKKEDVEDDKEDKKEEEKEVKEEAKEADDSKEEDSEKEDESEDKVEKSEEDEKDKEDPEDTPDPEDEVPEVKEESAAEAEAMIEAAKREAENEKKAQEDAREKKIEELTDAVRTLTEKLEAVSGLTEKIQELSEKVSKLEAQSGEVEEIKKNFREIVDEIGSENLDAIRKIESEKEDNSNENSSDGFWHKLLLNR